MIERKLIRHDVVASVRFVLYWTGAGSYALDEFYGIWEAMKPRWRGTAPKAVDATQDEVIDACYALGVLRGDHIWKSW